MVLTNTDRAFYTTVGPFLAKRDVVKAVGGPLWDDDTKTWLVLKDSRRKVMGFCAVALHHQGRTYIESLYVTDPSWRRVAVELVGHAVSRFGRNADLYAVVRREIVYAYLEAGFVETGETKDFVRLTRTPNTKEQGS